MRHRGIPDEGCRREIAQTQALHTFYRPRAVGGDLARACLQMPGRRAENGLAPKRGTNRAGAHPDDRPPHGLRVEHGVELDDAVNLSQRNPQFLADGFDDGSREETKSALGVEQHRQERRSPFSSMGIQDRSKIGQVSSRGLCHKGGLVASELGRGQRETKA